MGFLKDMKSTLGMDDKTMQSEHDVRGWQVKNETGQPLGKMDDWMIDQDARKARYGVVNANDRRVLLPVGDLDYDKTNRHVIAKGYDTDRLNKLEAYDAKSWDATKERDYYRAHHPEWKGELPDYTTDRFRAGEHECIQLLEERLNVGKRQVETGHVSLGKRVVEEQVSEPVELSQERIEINRKAVHKPVEGTANIGNNETINVTLFGEEAVAGKQAFIKEEIDVNKVRDTRTETINETLRHEELVTEGMDQQEFVSAQPTDADLKAKKRYEQERVDITPIDDKSGIDRPI